MEVRIRVEAALERQRMRFEETAIASNAGMRLAQVCEAIIELLNYLPFISR